ncbi:MAG: alpha/beta hydrolase, partial [Gammaproteobacteria bacterium]|nr:alpha/beta hydrolase [Gammaproteobacteria bacterium]NIR99378.1 alpha/beta hydrolase [Gammaproteobacteria bacterium]NIT64991.1 alpha/beta hydrolase [Gammaproteobacteria bacterium]NIV22014.1 alpha/beta fold hydrolase [Gammaproteobacteria bacterium]NIY33570.1 alpha/beta fold hydrolase [Gammaproteobacteria bacterium]
PQTWYIWRKVVPLLAGRFRLVMPDLRGYGDSDKPLGSYDKRTMAGDVRELAAHLGHERIALVGHDRGGRVAHRYALDHGETLAGLALLDIEPTKTKFDQLNRELALGSWHWLFLPQTDIAEALLSAAPEAALRHFLRGWAGNPSAIEEDAVAEYLRCFKLPGTIRATCADYHAGAHVDLEHDTADAERRIEAPLLVLWGGLGKRQQEWELLDVWREKAREVTGGPLPCGHFIPEEAPAELCAQLTP